MKWGCFGVAHVEKYAKGNVQGLSIHWDRKTLNHSNLDIDNERSDLNYDLCEKEGDTLSRMYDRLSEVHCLNRKDVKVCADWVVTLPESLKGASEKEQREFFEKTYEFLANRYGGEKNVLSANVHNDETTPHMHFAFMPVVWDEKKQREKVCANDVLIRKDLKTFHQDLDKFLKQKIPHIYKEGILNDKTIGVDTVKDLKKYSEEIQRQKEAMDAEVKVKEKELEGKIQSLDKELQGKKKELLDLSERLPNSKITIKTKKKEIKTEVKPKLIGKPEIIEKETGNYIFSPKQLEKVEELITAAVTIRKDYERLQNTDLVQENKELNRQVDSLYSDLKESYKINLELKKENEKLNTEIGSLKAHINDLKANVRVLYQQTKKVFKEQFKTFRGLIKNELDMKGIDNQFEREHKRGMTRQKGYDMER